MYIDINVLQTVPSSNINRDETGAPKTAIYGGVTRSRVSSQAWKRAIRDTFKDQTHDAAWLNGLRTLHAPKLLAEELHKQDDSINMETAINVADNALDGAKISVNKKDHTTKALFMTSRGQLEKAARFIIAHKDEYLAKKGPSKDTSKQLKDNFKDTNSVDMALFGRMVANATDLSVDAAAQVAHAISTHEIVPEFDFFSAVDDDEKDRLPGAAQLGTIQYNSATLYRYANINVDELVHNLNDEESINKGIKLFIKDFISTMPTGHQNTFANKTAAQYVMITIRPDTPVNLVSAFEDPVAPEAGYLKPSIKRLENAYQQTQKMVETPIKTIILTTETSQLENQAENIDDLLTQISDTITPTIQKEVSANEDTND